MSRFVTPSGMRLSCFVTPSVKLGTRVVFKRYDFVPISLEKGTPRVLNKVTPQEIQCPDEIQSLRFHNEFNNITPMLARETMELLFDWINLEVPAYFAWMDRTHAHILIPPLGEHRVALCYVQNIYPLFQLAGILAHERRSLLWKVPSYVVSDLAAGMKLLPIGKVFSLTEMLIHGFGKFQLLLCIEHL